MSLGKPGKLKMNLNINLNAMKPGAENPLIAKKRRESEIKLKQKKPRFEIKDNESKEEYKQHPEDTNALSAKLNQVTITTKRRKARRKPKKALILSDDTIDDEKSNFQNPLNPLPINTNNNDNNNNNNNSNGYIVSTSNIYDEKQEETDNVSSLIPDKPTPDGINGMNNDNKMSSTPQPPSTPTPPPPPPPGQAMETADDRRKSEFVDIKKTPPPPAPPMFSSINKAPRDTAASTTFTVSGQKITIIGHARTGKTSLKNALFGEEFKDMTFPTVRAPPKPTIVIKPLQIIDDDDDDDEDDDNAPDLAESDINVQYEIWDTPGQKVLEYIPPLYITGSFCVFVVYDITDTYSYKRAKYWITYLEENAKGYDNVVLIGNKYDLQIKQRCIQSQDVQIYAQQHGIFFIEISVKTKYNFDVLLSWLNQKTSEKVQKEIQIEEKNNNKKDDNNHNNDNMKQLNEEEKKKDDNDDEKKDNNKNKENKKRKADKKRLLKEHQRNNKTIQLDKIDVHSRNKKNRTCCLW